MNFHILLLAFLLVFALGSALRAAFSSLSKGLLRLLAIPLAFLLCYLFQHLGFFSFGGELVMSFLQDMEGLAPLLQASPYLQAFLEGVSTSLIAAVLFPLCFLIFYYIFRLVLRLALGKCLARLLDRETENKGVLCARMAGSAVAGAVGGVLLSAVLLMPIFYLFSFASAAVTCARTPCEEKIMLYDELVLVDETFVTPYEQAPAVVFYEATGLSHLMCRTAELASRTTLDGREIYASETVRALLTHVPNLYLHLEAWTISDAPMADDLTALADDPFLLGTLADIISHEAKAYATGQDGLLVSPGNEQESSTAYLVALFASTYGDATTEEIRGDLHTILAAGSILAESDFFNDFTRIFHTGTEGDDAMADVLISNLGYVGRLMDALYAGDPEHRLSDTIFDILLENEEVQKFVTRETIDDLNRAVAAGETTYESFTLFLQGLMGIIVN